MCTHIRVSGLSFFCTDEELRQAFIPFGTVVLAQVLRDESGHSLGLVHMARSENVERVFNAHQCFKLSDSRVDLWDPPTDPEDYQGERIMALTPRDPPAAQTEQGPGHQKGETALKPLTVRRPGLIRSQPPLFPDCQTLTSPQPSPGTQGKTR